MKFARIGDTMLLMPTNAFRGITFVQREGITLLRPLPRYCIGILLACSLLLATVMLSACTDTPRDLNAEVPIPLEMNQTTPEEAIRTYLEWLTYSYRHMKSDVATQTMTPDLARRVEYYITMNAAQNQALNQRLDSLEFIDTEIHGEVATVETREAWTFNYLALDTGTFGDPVVAHYKVIYTVLLIDGVWRVQSANAEELNPDGTPLVTSEMPAVTDDHLNEE